MYSAAMLNFHRRAAYKNSSFVENMIYQLAIYVTYNMIMMAHSQRNVTENLGTNT
jgi:GTP cyclohydrolase FolE2